MVGLSIIRWQKYVLNRIGSLTATLLGAFAGIIFILLGFPEIVNTLPTGLNVQTLSLIFFSGYAFVTLLLGYFGPWSKRRGLSMWIQSNILLLYSLIYYLRLNTTTFTFESLTLNRGFTFFPLLILLFLVNRNLYAQAKKKTYLLIAEILLIHVSTFSLLNLLDTIPADFSTSNNLLLRVIFEIPQTVWLVVGGVFTSVLTTLNLRLSRYREVFLFTGFGGSVFIATTLVLNALTLSYWYQALLFVVFWDFAYHLLAPVGQHRQEKNYLAKLLISGGYHLVLFGVVFYFGVYA